MMPKTIRKKLILVNLCVENAAQKPLELPAQEALLINKHVNKSTAARDKCNKQTKFNCSLNINTWEEAELRLYTVYKLSGGLELDCEKLKRTLMFIKWWSLLLKCLQIGKRKEKFFTRQWPHTPMSRYCTHTRTESHDESHDESQNCAQHKGNEQITRKNISKNTQHQNKI